MNSKELLIEQCRGEIKNIRELAKTFAENDIHDKNGYVDNDFLLSVLSLMAAVGKFRNQNKREKV